jgi:prevent-host-death family protein
MARSIWSVQEAKNRFRAMMGAARRQPQTVTKHGRPAVVVVDVTEYERLKKLEQLEAPPFNEHLLAIPAQDGRAEALVGELRDTDV